MFRFRRYRVFLGIAVIAALLLVRFTRTQNWEQYTQAGAFRLSGPKWGDEQDASPAQQVASVAAKASSTGVVGHTQATGVPSPSENEPSPVDHSVPAVGLPDRKTPPPGDFIAPSFLTGIQPIAPGGRQDMPNWDPKPTTTIHWQKQKEHFPVPTASLIPLPTGNLASIPKIQHAFKDETPDAKISREKRQAGVKGEFLKSWEGYKKFAWGHDELKPVSGTFKDPFCGWAATLVDTLDTLWIMGLNKEFEEAVKQVEKIDFTTTERMDIPVFETTIRYLGGLLSAYDLSGEKYKSLLDKAVELAEVLMGAFDTPNRMPVLFYPWRPTWASQPHRAANRANLAELGSLSLEFTRLAQHTKEPKYYDAVARITNALEEWQERGTKLKGVFPEWVDASGCNFTAPPVTQPVAKNALGGTVDQAVEEPEGYKPNVPATVKEMKPKKKEPADGIGGPGTLEVQMVPGRQTKAQIVPYDQGKQSSKKDLESDVKRGVEDSPTPIAPLSPLGETSRKVNPISGQQLSANQPESDGGWDCVPQGLESAQGPRTFDKFSMGGGQDSTYEYFPKQYLLLGGREKKYKDMYINTMKAVREWMLYRPMVPDNKNILFSGSILTAGNPKEDSKLGPEIEHLTCFIGGMVGLGAKVFGIDGDLELAKKLTDGCVWAYDVTPSGVMAEGGSVMPCKSANDCTWNQTAYDLFMDPLGANRDKEVATYMANKDKLDAAQVKKDAEAAEAEAARKKALAVGLVKEDAAPSAQPEMTSLSSKPALLRRSEPDAGAKQTKEEMMAKMAQQAESELENMYAGRTKDLGKTPQTPIVDRPAQDSLKPVSHKEYVANRVKHESLPPGYVSVHSRKYILRPEAIESVWYMYRITGDSAWQEKGWEMFQSVIEATSTKYGHSAIFDATMEETYHTDEMESFWLAETLKYFYLLFSTPDTISLDEWVLNTEAHPFRRPVE